MQQFTPSVFGDGPTPVKTGVGLKPCHYQIILDTLPDVGWFEVHTENYMGSGGPPHRYLDAIRQHYPLSFHGVSLSLGSAQPLNRPLLDRTRALIDRYQPSLVSEHLSWSVVGETYFNDLLPLPYTEESLKLTIDHVAETQDVLGRRILIENPSTYLQFSASDLTESEFLSEIVTHTGCGLLVDINNLYVNAGNHGIDPVKWMTEIPVTAVGELHLGGHHVNRHDHRKILIDDHGSAVADPVWELYQTALDLLGMSPTLVEWDTGVPAFHVLHEEAKRADAVAAGWMSQGKICQLAGPVPANA